MSIERLKELEAKAGQTTVKRSEAKKMQENKMDFDCFLTGDIPDYIKIDPALLPSLAKEIVEALDQSSGEDRVSVVLSYLSIRLMRF